MKCAWQEYLQILPIWMRSRVDNLGAEKLEELRENVRFNIWEWLDDDTAAVRFATSWSTTRESIEELEKLLFD